VAVLPRRKAWHEFCSVELAYFESFRTTCTSAQILQCSLVRLAKHIKFAWYEVRQEDTSCFRGDCSTKGCSLKTWELIKGVLYAVRSS
jgi:hypothetical protein